uniref:Putative head tail connector protein n=1 Tax=viral metagenome TaxID=1070528 RepID=A0A6M3K5G6_9ZZZZ
MPILTTVQELEKRHDFARSQYENWQSEHKDICRFVAPTIGRWPDFGESEQDAGNKRHSKIIDGTAPKALKLLASGLQSGLTSPSRPWFRMTLLNEDLAKWKPVREWLDYGERILYSIYSVSNFYSQAHRLYYEQAAVGTSAILADSHPEEVVRYSTLTIGEYYLIANALAEIDTLFHTLWIPAINLIEMYGEDNEGISDAVRNAKNNEPYKLFRVIHAIMPNITADPLRLDNQNMPYASVRYLKEANNNNALTVSGYMSKPFAAPRWFSVGSEIYGYGLGHDNLGDSKMLQSEQASKLKGLQKMIEPPLVGPPGYNRKVSHLPGALNIADDSSASSLKPMYEIKPAIAEMMAEINDVRQQIRAGFFNDLFLMMLERPQMTATEVAQRHEEKLLALGPVIENQMDEFLDPIVTRTWEVANAAGMVPPPPQEIEGQAMKIEYISILAQLQKLVGTNTINAFSQFVFGVAEAMVASGRPPDILDKFNSDEAADEYSIMTGVPPNMVNSAEEVAQIRAQRAQQQQAMMQAQAMQQGSEVARNLAQAKTGDESALTQLQDSMEGR